MRITQTQNHGKPRFRVNIQSGDFRKRLFFNTYSEAVNFANATGGLVRLGKGKKSSQPPPAPIQTAQTQPGFLDDLHAWLFSGD